jgi:hypothetical protein
MSRLGSANDTCVIACLPSSSLMLLGRFNVAFGFFTSRLPAYSMKPSNIPIPNSSLTIIDTQIDYYGAITSPL